jgi:hypothetical protein
VSADGYVASGGKRLALERSEWMGDWFVGASPRNGNNFAEGQWAHWVALACNILRHEATSVTHPDIHAIAQALPELDYYADGPALTDDDLARLFPEDAS